MLQVAAAVSALRGFAKREPLLRRSRGPEANQERASLWQIPATVAVCPLPAVLKNMHVVLD